MTAAGAPDHDLVHSGSRWEPVPVPASWSVPPGGGSAASPRTGRGRRALLVLAGLACLLLGGAGGWALGHATGGSGAVSPAPAGSFGPGPGGGSDGDGDGFGGGFRHHGLPGTGPGTGTGGTIGGTGAGGSGDGGTV